MSDYRNFAEEPLTELELLFIQELLDFLYHGKQNNIHVHQTPGLRDADACWSGKI